MNGGSTLHLQKVIPVRSRKEVLKLQKFEHGRGKPRQQVQEQEDKEERTRRPTIWTKVMLLWILISFDRALTDNP
jgi:hypothetical protein